MLKEKRIETLKILFIKKPNGIMIIHNFIDAICIEDLFKIV
jgi:hypothetical protein